MKKAHKEDAVSPVIGVMLMLVVTIIIAAVVAAFAGGLATDAERAPSAVLKAEVDSKWTNYMGTGSAFLTSLSGENVNLDKIVVTLYDEKGNSYSYIHPSEAGGVGKYLESGETLNLAYGLTNSKGYIFLCDSTYGYGYDTGVLPYITSGQYVRVIVTYDDTHVLYDNEVIVV